MGRFPGIDNGANALISLGQREAARWAISPRSAARRILRSTIRRKSKPRSELGRLIGMSAVSRATGFARFARTMMKPLYVELYAIPYYRQVTGEVGGGFLGGGWGDAFNAPDNDAPTVCFKRLYSIYRRSMQK